eukprot:CAMPEP_0170140756 /NCGR_PEP_ID=MMETSP0033_2-20121228/6565_1 /TAXON_ID=195969 /ORGANISM="Dolichomastix tenuilepis, Strain CCMP3274" /LENGTH=189 /DNA_ID=CAMNT_0010376987 /DNA_START=27 /DNA_END=596 /DNA_ORIENTATION=+
MRPLEEGEVKLVFEKLHKFIGKSVRDLVAQKDNPHVFRLHKNRVYFVRDDIMKKATNVSRDKLVHFGTCIGKLTHSGKFRLTITALELLSKYAKHKVWLKPSAEMSFAYGHHVMKSGLGRITEDTPNNAGVVVYSMSDVPLGFGTAARSTQECRKLEAGAIVAYHIADIGEYIRSEEDIAGVSGGTKKE